MSGISGSGGRLSSRALGVPASTTASARRGASPSASSRAATSHQAALSPAVTKSLHPCSSRSSRRVVRSAGRTLLFSVTHSAPRLAGAAGHSARRAAW
ncbi:hypothetical protein D9M70_237450 [compost metagenome]